MRCCAVDGASPHGMPWSGDSSGMGLGWMSWLTSITFTIKGRGFSVSVSEGGGCWEVGVVFGVVFGECCSWIG